jgi:chitinase
MSLRALLDTWMRRPYSRREEPKTSRLAVETLEDRLTPAAMLTIGDASIVEGDSGITNVLVQVNLTEPHGNAVTVNWNTAPGSATAGSDYNTASGSLTFTKSQMSKILSIPVRGDTLAESSESFTVRLSNAKGAKIADATANVTITDDDPRISIRDWSAAEGNDGTKEFTFDVTLSSAAAGTVTVDFATADGTALVSENDYVEQHGTLTFEPGQPLTQTIKVVVNDDQLAENTEAFYVNLSNASSNAQISDGAAAGTITDDEPRISITGWSAWEGNDGTTEYTFTVTLSAEYGHTVTVDFATADGSATVDDSDYVENHGTLTFDPYQTSQEIKVVVNGDMNAEYDEYFMVNLSNASPNARISNSVAYGNIYNDEPTVTIYDTWFYYDSSYMVFTVALSTAPTEGEVTVDWQTWDGSAIAGCDYVGNAGTLTFGIGETTQYIYVEILNFNYTDLYFYVQISNPSPPVTLANEWAVGYWYYDYYYYDPGYYYYDYYYYGY